MSHILHFFHDAIVFTLTAEVIIFCDT